MDYQKTIDYLFGQLPMFHRIGPAAYKPDLSNTIALMDMTGHPYRSFPSVHIAGTNGKGSVSNMLSAVLQEAGYRVGLYTSPHLIDFRERIRVNGQMIPKEAVVRFVDEYRERFEAIRPSFFEWTVALAFSHFRDSRIDIAVVETGLGGRLDSTNVITPELAVITNIGWDHANLLGDTLEKIAGEKAGIIKKGVPVVVGERDPVTENVFTRTAASLATEIEFASDTYRVVADGTGSFFQDVLVTPAQGRMATRYRLGLSGDFQHRNLATVLASIDVLRKRGHAIAQEHLDSGLQDVCRLTGFAGRWQLLSENPAVIADVGHNEHGIREVVRQLKGIVYRKLIVVTGMVRDKDISRVLACLPGEAAYHFCQPDLPRALPVEELVQAARTAGLEGVAHPTVSEAVSAARAQAAAEDLVLIVGSTFVVAEALPLFREV